MPISWHSDLKTYHAGLRKSNDLRPGYTTVHPVDYYAEEDRERKVYHDHRGEVGFALLPHWKQDEITGLHTRDPSGHHEIAGVYNHGGERTKGWGVHAIQKAFKEGGDYLEAFEGDDKFSLPRYYHKHLGAQPVGYLPWDDQYTPDGWNHDVDGRPGIVQLKVPPTAASDVDRWLSMDHKADSYEEFVERLRHYKKKAGVKIEENNNNNQPKNKFRDHEYNPDEYDRLVDGVDEFYFKELPVEKDKGVIEGIIETEEQKKFPKK